MDKGPVLLDPTKAMQDLADGLGKQADQDLKKQIEISLRSDCLKEVAGFPTEEF